MKAHAKGKKAKQGKEVATYVKVNLPKTNGKQSNRPSMGVIVTVPANTTLVGVFGNGNKGKKKGMAGVVPINATTVAWRPVKTSGKRKLTANVRVRVDYGYPYSTLPIGIAGFTGDLCIGGQTTVTVPVKPSKHDNTNKEKAPKSGKL